MRRLFRLRGFQIRGIGTIYEGDARQHEEKKILKEKEIKDKIGKYNKLKDKKLKHILDDRFSRPSTLIMSSVT